MVKNCFSVMVARISLQWLCEILPIKLAIKYKMVTNENLIGKLCDRGKFFI